MTISHYPSDDYYAITCYKHTLAEIILDAHNNDYECYEGTLVDNYVMANPYPFDITQVKDLRSGDWDDEFVTFFKTQTYKYLVILERYESQWSSSNELIYTNDDEWVARIESMFQSTQESTKELQLV